MEHLGTRIGIKLLAIFSGILLLAGTGVIQQTSATRICDGANPISSEVVNDNVSVPAGEDCEIDSSTINGNVVVKGDGDLDVFDLTTITGKVKGKGPNGSISIEDSTVDGKVDVKKKDKVLLSDSTFGGDIKVKQLIENPAKKTFNFVLDQSTVDGNVSVEKSFGIIIINDNIIDGFIKVKKFIDQIFFAIVLIDFNDVGDSIIIEKNSSPVSIDFRVRDNDIGKDLKVEKNRHV